MASTAFIPPAVRSAGKIVLPLALSGGLLLFLAYRVDFAALTSALASTPWPQLALAIFFVTVSFVLSSLRFYYLLLAVRPHLSLKLSSAIGLNLATCLSAHALGLLSDGLRIHALTQKGASLAESTKLVIADRLLALWLLAAAMALLLPVSGLPVPFFWLWAGLGAGLAMLLGGLTFLRAPLWPRWLHDCGLALVHSLWPLRWLVVQGLTLLTYCLFYALAIYSLSSALLPGLAFGTCLFLAPTIILASSLPLTYVGLGVRESLLVVLLPFIAPQTTPEQAMALALALGAAMLAASLPGILFLPSALKGQNR